MASFRPCGSNTHGSADVEVRTVSRPFISGCNTLRTLSLTFVTFVRKLVAPVWGHSRIRPGRQCRPGGLEFIHRLRRHWQPPFGLTQTCFNRSASKTGLKAALSESQVDSRLRHLADLAAGLSLAEIRNVLKAADDLKELRERMVFKQSLWQRWGELAPEDAFSHLAPLPESQWKLNTLRQGGRAICRAKPRSCRLGCLPPA